MVFLDKNMKSREGQSRCCKFTKCGSGGDKEHKSKEPELPKKRKA